MCMIGTHIWRVKIQQNCITIKVLLWGKCREIFVKSEKIIYFPYFIYAQVYYKNYLLGHKLRKKIRQNAKTPNSTHFHHRINPMVLFSQLSVRGRNFGVGELPQGIFVPSATNGMDSG